MLRACCERMTDLRVPAGQVVVRQGEPGDATYFVVEGSVTVTMKTDDGTELNVGVLVAPHVVGLLQLLTGGLRTETATAAVDTLLWKVDRADFAWAAEQFPGGLAAIIAILRTRMRAAHARTVLASALGEAALAALGEHIDWRDLRRGELLYRQGERCDGLYVVVSGLMEVSRDEAGKSQLVGRYGRGVLIGEAEVFAGTDRRGTAVAVRDSALVRISRDVFRAIALQNAELLWRITERSFHRLLDGRADAEQSGGQLFAVVPLNAGIDGKDFCARLVTQLSAMGRTLWVSPERLAAAGVMDAALDIEDDHPSWMHFHTWFDSETARHDFVVLEAGAKETAWARRAVRQADQVLLVARSDDTTQPGATEAWVEALRAPAAPTRYHLVLLREGSDAPGGTARWLEGRSVHGHHHVRVGREQDLGRVARLISGRALGLALGGGGARGFAHLGVIQAFNELGIPIDAIGGTSMGSIIAGQYAMGLDPNEMVELNGRITRLKPFNEYTLPVHLVVAHAQD